MILVIGHYPSKKNERDGMVQRISAIDLLLQKYDRIYISTNKIRKSSYFIKHPIKWIAEKIKRNIFSKSNVRVYNYVDSKSLSNLAKKAKIIYVHSIYFLQTLSDELIKEHGHKIILDLHGCVVEESLFTNSNVKIISVLERVENVGFKNIRNIIAVSNNMVEFYKNKYDTNANFICLPIFTLDQLLETKKYNSSKFNVIYSGGTQKWQNIELMSHSMTEASSLYSYTILSPHKDVFLQLFQGASNLSGVTIKSVSSGEVGAYYKEAHLGFVLRSDNIVNKVSCPTKLIEYIQYGIIPIVLQPEIGDFNTLGYSYILNEDFKNGKLPSPDILKSMAVHNYTIINDLVKQCTSSKNQIIELIEKAEGIS